MRSISAILFNAIQLTKREKDRNSQFHWVDVMKICIKYEIVYGMVENPGC